MGKKCVTPVRLEINNGLAGIHKAKTTLEGNMRRWEDIINMILKETRC